MAEFRMTAVAGSRNHFANAVRIALNSDITEAEIHMTVRQIVVWRRVSDGSECVKIAREALACTKRSAAAHPPASASEGL